MPAAEAKNADGASLANLLIPRPPMFTGNNAWDQLSKVAQLHIANGFQNALLKQIYVRKDWGGRTWSSSREIQNLGE